MGEKFDTNPVTGTASLTVPILTSPGRDGFGPTLSLSYDSGNGHGPFGFGWSLGLDSITRKTSKGLPQYKDDIELDVFVISGAEDLVPALLPDGSRHEDRASVPGYVIHRYKPRIEGSYRRVDRWTKLEAEGDVHWRVYSSDDTLSIYGRSENSRIFNQVAPEQTFSWLISDTRDWRGNAMTFTYKSENGDGVDLSKNHQKRRGRADGVIRQANRYIKSIRYGNRTTLLDTHGQRVVFPSQAALDDLGWMFEIVFDYGEHDDQSPTPRENTPWKHRPDAFSRYTSGFEVRTARLCRRVLMFHHFEHEDNVGMDCLTRSTDFIYLTNGVDANIYSFLAEVEQSGYRHDSREVSGYVKRSMPRLEFKYSEPSVQDDLRTIEREALENIPSGLAEPQTRCIDLFGEGVSGILTELDGVWYYKRNITPISELVQPDGSRVSRPMFDHMETVPSLPNMTNIGNIQWMDLEGDGFVSIVTDSGTLGYYQSSGKEEWEAWRPFDSTFKASLDSEALHLVDLTGDGHPDAVMTDQSVWYPSLGTKGFGAPEGFTIDLEECENPWQLFKSKPLARVRFCFGDMSGDGMQDVVLIGNGEVCFWPSLGYGRFGAKIVMDHPPEFDDDDYFDPERVLLGDIDGSGTTDLIYLHRCGPRLYFNQCGNSWSDAKMLASATNISAFLDVSIIDIHGNGTSCLVISDPLPTAESPMQYVDLMGGVKPHLLVEFENNMGASTKIHYSTSTKFYLQDRKVGRPWISRLPYPVAVVEFTETFDHISRNVFTSSFAYHHGHYDGVEREFRGFGMVEQWDTENLSPISFPDSSNTAEEYSLPATYTKSWFHLGLSKDFNTISRQYEREYFHNPGWWLLPDTILPAEVEAAEEYDACRALKGRLLRQEIYMNDAQVDSSDAEIQKAKTPVSFSETNYTIEKLQQGSSNASAVFRATPREILTYHLERDVSDPRITQQIILERNEYGQILREVAIAYGRADQDAALPTPWDRDAQTKTYMTYSESKVTNPIDDPARFPHAYRVPMNCQHREYELTGFVPPEPGSPFSLDQFSTDNFKLLEDAEEIPYEAQPDLSKTQKRLLGLSRTICRSDDLASSLPLGQMDVCGIILQSYGLVFTAALFDSVYQRGGLPLVPSRDSVLTSQDGDGGGYYSSSELKSSDQFPEDDPYDGYWTGSGLIFYSQSDDVLQELNDARSSFYSFIRTRNVFGVESSVTYDDYTMLVVEAEDSAGNIATIGERDGGGNRISNGNDYRTLQPLLLTDANGNRTAVATDALGAVVGSAVMGKVGEPVGDTLQGFEPDLPESIVLAHMTNPTADPRAILHGATWRAVYDLGAYTRTKSSGSPQPVASYSLSRVTHEEDLAENEEPEMHHAFSYTDGFGRDVQTKAQTRPGPVAQRDADGRIIFDEDGQPVLTDEPSNPRWISSGWTIYNNKGLTVAQYEPWFTHMHTFEFDVRAGVSSIAFYDAMGRNVATVHPNGAYTKTVFTTWTSEAWDNNDTVELDPRTDTDVKQYTKAYFATKPTFQTWFQQRMALPERDRRRQAAEKSKVHAGTCVVSHFDSLSRVYLKVGWNRVACLDHELDGQEWKQHTRIEFDIQGHGLAVRDSDTMNGNDLPGRIVEMFQYDMAGRAMIRRSMDSGTTTYLQNAVEEPLYQWDDRGHRLKTVYDKAGRHLLTSVTGDVHSPSGPTTECIVNYKVYGEHHPRAAELNLKSRTYLVVDQAGLTVNERRDFKGNLLENSKRLNTEYKKTVDWKGLEAIIPMDMDSAAFVDEGALWSFLDSHLEPEAFRGFASFDALSRPVSITSPNSNNGNQSVTFFSYEINSLVQVSAIIRGESATPAPIVADLQYDARSVRQSVTYANGVTTTYKYSSTGELVRLLSTRPSSGGTDVLQDLRYTYDPSNMRSTIEDAAQQTVYFRNRVVEPVTDYTYDALCQLIRASGREHLGQPGGSPIPYSHEDSARSGPQPGDGGAMGTYREDYVYDRTGNMKKMKHSVDDPLAPGHTWTKVFEHNEPSTLEPAKFGNRLTSTSISSSVEQYLYDAHGNMTRMPHLGGSAGTPNVTWNYLDQQKQVDLGGGGTAYYVYDASGQRVRKIIERSPNLIQERIYLGATLEIFRRHQSGQVTLERESFHVGDDVDRVALIETRTLDINGTDRAPRQVHRYRLKNHQGSATVELDDQARVLTYEEYSPYGSTTYAGVDGSLELPKRYRFTGKERDEETGLSYHGARYYAPWLARWTSADPGGGMDGLNLYQYCLSNPVHYVDGNGASPSLGPPEWLRDIFKGHDAQDMVWEYVKTIEQGAEKEVWVARWKDAVLKAGFDGFKRLDIITKDGMIQVKYIELKDAVTGAMKDSAVLEKRILNGVADAKAEVAAAKEYLGAAGKGGWINERLSKVWAGLKGAMPKHTLVFVVEGEASEIFQFEGLVRQTMERVAKGHAYEVVQGTGKSFATIAKERAARAAGKLAEAAAKAAAKGVAKKAAVAGAAWGLSKVASKLIPGIGLATATHDLATATNWTDRIIAGAEVVGGVLEFVPGLNAVGMGINLAMLGARAGVAAYRATQGEGDGGDAGQPVEKPAAAPAEAAPKTTTQPGPVQAVSPDPPSVVRAGPTESKASGVRIELPSLNPMRDMRSNGNQQPNGLELRIQW